MKFYKGLLWAALLSTLIWVGLYFAIKGFEVVYNFILGGF